MKKAVVLLSLILIPFLFGVCEAGVEGVFERARERYLKFREVVTDITMVQTITIRGETIIERKIYKKGEMFRIEEVDNEGVLIIDVYDGENSWLVVPERGIRKKLPQEGRKDVLLDDWFNFFVGLKLDRVERIGERDCYVLAREDKFLWIDRESYALIKVKGKGYDEGAGEKEKFTIIFSNFRDIEGWEIPLASRASKGGKTAFSELSLDVETVLPMELFCAESIEIGAPPLPPWLLEPPPTPPE